MSPCLPARYCGVSAIVIGPPTFVVTPPRTMRYCTVVPKVAFSPFGHLKRDRDVIGPAERLLMSRWLAPVPLVVQRGRGIDPDQRRLCSHARDLAARASERQVVRTE